MKSYARLSQFGDVYFQKYLIGSLVAHCIFFLFTALAPYIPVLKGKQTMMRYSTTIRVDMIDLPRELLHELEPEIVSTQDVIKSLKKDVKESFKDPDAMQLKTKDAVSRLKKQTQASLDRLKSHENAEAQKLKERIESLRRGNVETPGVQTPTANQGGEQLDAYRSQIAEKIKLRWALPFYLRQQSELSGELIIYLDSDGGVVRKQIISSGNKDFDEFMNRALEESLPFTSVPQDIQKDLRYDGVRIKFFAQELR